jgi:hypothetical protein
VTQKRGRLTISYVFVIAKTETYSWTPLAASLSIGIFTKKRFEANIVKLPGFRVSWLRTNFCVVSPFEVKSEAVIINRVL